MTILEFQQVVFEAAAASDLCDIPSILRLGPAAVKIRVPLIGGGWIDAFYNEETGTTAYALIRDNRRVFGADNTGGWHLHPFDNPKGHVPLSSPMAFDEFVALIEAQER